MYTYMSNVVATSETKWSFCILQNCLFYAALKSPLFMLTSTIEPCWSVVFACGGGPVPAGRQMCGPPLWPECAQPMQSLLRTASPFTPAAKTP